MRKIFRGDRLPIHQVGSLVPKCSRHTPTTTAAFGDRIKGVIFDFDGTLVRSHEQVFAVLEELAQEYGLTLPTAEKFRHLSTMEAIRALGLRLWQVPRFTALARKRLSVKLEAVNFEPGMMTLLHELRGLAPLQIGLVSSNSAQNITQVLDKFDARKLFDHILCGSSLLGKQRNLAKMIKQMSLTPADCLYVGDETRDIEASKNIGLQVVAVAWGFHSIERLTSCQPHHSANTVKDLRTLILGHLSPVN